MHILRAIKDFNVENDDIIIKGSPLTGGTVDSCNDHRIAMSLAILCSKVGGTLEEAQCVKKSYPEFFDNIKTLGIQI